MSMHCRPLIAAVLAAGWAWATPAAATVIADATLDYQPGTSAGDTVMPADTFGTGTWQYLASATENPTSAGAALADLAWDTALQGFERGQFSHTNGYDQDLIQINSGELNLSPGATPSTNYVLMRWTAGTGEAGQIDIDGLVRSRDVGRGDGRRFLIFVDGVNVFSETILPDNLAGETIDLNGVSVGLGSTVDFVVGNNGTNDFDSTGFAATITLLPEPSVAGLLAAGLMMVGLRRRSA